MFEDDARIRPHSASIELGNVRRSSPLDAPHIRELAADASGTLLSRFHTLDPEQLITQSVLALSVLDDTNKVVGFACFDDAPYSVGDDERMCRARWPLWCKENLTSRDGETLAPDSMLWLRFFVAARTCDLKVAEKALPIAFAMMPKLQRIAYALPSDVTPFVPLHEMFDELMHENCGDSPWRVFTSPRPPSRVRVARIEDHDDLVPVFDEQSDVVREVYGDYFLADIIEAQDDDNRAFVLEMEGRACGLLSVTTEISAGVLADAFDLTPYNYFHRSKVRAETTVDDAPARADPTLDTVFETLMKMAEPAEAAAAEDEADDGRSETLLEPDVAETEMEPRTSKGSVINLLTQFFEAIDNDCSCEQAHQVIEHLQVRRHGDDDDVDDDDVRDHEEISLMTFKQAVCQIVDAVHNHNNLELTPPEIVEVLFAILGVGGHDDTAEAADDDTNSNEALTLDFGEVDTSNVLCITLFCVERLYEWASEDFIGAVFDAFPDRNYLMVTAPHASETLPLFASFVALTPNPLSEQSVFDHVLSVMSRVAVEERIALQKAVEENLPDIDTFLRELSDVYRKKLLEHVADTISDSALNTKKSLVVFANEQVVGLVNLVVLQPAELGAFAAVNDMEAAGAGSGTVEAARLCAFVINPLFHSRRRFVLGEVMRLLDLSVIVYGVEPDADVVNVLDLFVYVRARRRPHSIRLPVSDDVVDDDDDDTAIYGTTKTQAAFNLFTKAQLSEQKTVVNSRIVVVGASETGLSVLRRLQNVSKVHFANVSLVAPNSAASLDAVDPFELGRVSTLQLDGAELRRLALDARVRLVQQRVASLRRDEQRLMLDDGGALSYDYLVLCTGRHGQTVARARARGAMPADLKGAFDVSDSIELRLGRAYLHTFAQAPVVIYGAGLEAVALIDRVMRDGTPGSHIVWLDPMPPSLLLLQNDNAAAASDVDMQRAILELIRKSGVERLPAAEFVSATSSTSSGHIQSIRVRISVAGDAAARSSSRLRPSPATVTEEASSSSFAVFELTCHGLLCLHDKDVDGDVFNAITGERPLAYNGGLIVDGAFRTVDEFVYSGGSMAKFSRRLSTSLDMRHCSTAELGDKIAESLLQVVDPTRLVEEVEACNDAPVFERPRTIFVRLPERHCYFHSALPPEPASVESVPDVPGSSNSSRQWHQTNEIEPRDQRERPQPEQEQQPPLPQQLQQQQQQQQHKAENRFRELTTKVSGRHISIRVDALGIIHSLSYLGTHRIFAYDLESLVGMSVGALNNLEKRLIDGSVYDIVAFLEEHWASALSHDRFEELRSSVQEMLRSSNTFEAASSLVSRCFDAVNDGDSPADAIDWSKVEALGDSLVRATKTQIQRRLLRFVEHNQDNLPGYLFDASSGEP